MEPSRSGPSSVRTGQRRHVRAISNSAINVLRVHFLFFCIFITDHDLLFKIHLFLFYTSRLSAKYYLFYLSVHRFTFMSSLFLDLFVHFFLLPTSLTLLHLSPPCLTLPYLPLSPLRLHSESESLSMQLAQGHRADRAVRCGSSTVLAVRYTLIGHSNEPYRSLLWL